jgi:hypothetical protein
MAEPETPAIDETARNLIRQLDRFADGHKASGDAFVASVYGEWGVGKTYCLKAVHAHYDKRLDDALQATGPLARLLVVPVLFVPWRYEHEEHLIVPLLKTLEHALKGIEDRVREAGKTRGLTVAVVDGITNSLIHGWKTLAGVARATAASVKLKAAPAGVGFEIDGAAALNSSKASPDSANSLDELSSHYFDAEKRLAAITEERMVGEAGHEAALSLRLVVLVDDLDRCLPEKAVQVLESVKLFLNVPGFSFVLAVDDEVVERGIAHRYREYRLADKDGAFVGELPISGTQYLEKIVHLPVHLPRWTRSKAERFLLGSYPELYALRPDSQRARHEAQQSEPVANEVLKLLLDAVPLVPRKLIRLSEGMDYLQGQLRELGHADKWAPLHALRVVALQQLHPVLYRHIRLRSSRYPRLFEIERDAWHEPRYRGTGKGLRDLKEAYESRRQSLAIGDKTVPDGAQADTLREQLDLLDRLHHCASQRGAGHPLDFFGGAAEAGLPDGLNWEQFLQLFFHHEPLPAPPVVPPPGHYLPTADLPDAQAAVSALLNPDRVSRREFIESRQLDGKQLPATVFEQLLKSLTQSRASKELVLDLDWLRDLSAISSPEQLLRLYAQAQVLRHWKEATST